MSSTRHRREVAAAPSPVIAAVAGKRAVTESIRAGVVTEVLVLRGARETQGLREVIAAAKAADLSIRSEDGDTLDRLADDHRGVVAITRLPATLSERDLDDFEFGDDALVVVLDGVTDPQNLGAAARVADGAGAALMITRVKRSAGITSSAIRASSGALVTLPHARVANITKAIQRLQRAGFQVVGLDENAPHDIYSTPFPGGPIAVVIGAEGSGLSRLVAESCDIRLALPMHGRVASLNAATALAAMLYGFVLPGGSSAKKGETR